MTDPLRDALAEAYASLLIRSDINPTDVDANADAILAHPAVIAALDRSGSVEGLREAAHDVVEHESGRHPYLACGMAGHIDALAVALAATPTASRPDRERVTCVCGRSVLPENWENHTHRVSDRPHRRAASPTAGGLDALGRIRSIARQRHEPTAHPLVMLDLIEEIARAALPSEARSDD